MRKVNLKPSSNIQSAYYDVDNKVLIIEYKSGTYKYVGVEPERIEEWERVTRTPAGSVGSYVHHFIRDKYEYERMDISN